MRRPNSKAALMAAARKRRKVREAVQAALLVETTLWFLFVTYSTMF